MTANVRSADIAKSITDNLNGDLPLDTAELEALLVTAARLGKIAGLRRARKLTRRGQFYRIGQSIRNTYIALGFDTDEYEAEKAQEAQARLDAALGQVGYEAGVAVITAYDADTLTVDLGEPQHSAFSNNVVAGFAGLPDVTLPSAPVTTED